MFRYVQHSPALSPEFRLLLQEWRTEKHFMCGFSFIYFCVVAGRKRQWANVPRFSEGPWERCSQRISKTVRGTRAKRRVLRTAFFFRSEDLHYPRGPQGETWNLFIIPWFCWFTPVRKTWNIGSTVFQCPTFSQTGGHWKIVLPMSHVFQKLGDMKKTVLPMSHVLCRTLENVPSSSKE